MYQIVLHWTLMIVDDTLIFSEWNWILFLVAFEMKHARTIPGPEFHVGDLPMLKSVDKRNGLQQSKL